MLVRNSREAPSHSKKRRILLADLSSQKSSAVVYFPCSLIMYMHEPGLLRMARYTPSPSSESHHVNSATVVLDWHPLQ